VPNVLPPGPVPHDHRLVDVSPQAQHEPVGVSRLGGQALALRRRFPGARGLAAFTGVSVVASWSLSSLTYLLVDPGMFTSVLGQLLPVLTPVVLALPVYAVLFTLVDDLDAEIARREETEAVLRTYAGQDDLTGLANRRALVSELAARLADGSAQAVAMFDLDHFKQVNDVHGHAAGDRALVSVAQAATAAVGPQGLVSRLGGEEFAVVLHPGGEVLEEVLARLLELIRAAGREVGTTASIGATLVRPGDTVDSVLLRADALLYRAKAAGRDRVVVDPEPQDATEGAAEPA
jgi:diguanylate cyclase (GGDEF)-like protein